MYITTKTIFGIAVAILFCTQASAQSVHGNSSAQTADSSSRTTSPYGFGTDVTKEELSGFFSSAPDGHGLPEGSGTVMQGKKVYSAQCVACHGAKLEGGIGDPLVGGRGSLNTDKPIKTVESYWPYSTTLFDYIKRAMPFTMPGSLSDDEVYAVTAYILNQAGIVPDDASLDQTSLPKVKMPNRGGFEDAGR